MDISFTNARGVTVIFGPPTYRVISIEGLGDVEAEIQTQKSPYQHGSTFVDALLGERVLPMEIKIYGDSEADMSSKRRFLSNVFNPAWGMGQFKIQVGEVIYTVDAIPDFIPKYAGGVENMGTFYQYCQIQVTAPYPYWRDPQQLSRALRAYQGKFTLPMQFPVELGIEGDNTILDNTGDIKAPIQIDVQGPITYPRVTNETTGEFIQFNRALSSDEILHIDTQKGNKRVEIYRDGWPIQNAMGYLDHDSTFLQLVPGENQLSLTARAGDMNGIVSVAWHNYFAGI